MSRGWHAAGVTVITDRELNRATLARQLLLERADVGVEEAVRRTVALQAQEAASPYLALWNRVVDLDPAAVDRAFADGRVVKATLLRITLHAVHLEDHGALHTAMQPTLRAARLNDRRFTETGLTSDDADQLVPELLAWCSTGRTNAEAEVWLAERGIDHPRLWWAVRHYAPLRHAPTGGPWSFGRRPAYLAADAPLPEPGDRDAADRALQTLVVRYLQGFGPATVADMAQFALVQRGRLRPAVAALGDQLEQLEGTDGTVLYDVPGSPRPAGDVAAPPRLLPMWDSTLFAHHDRSRIIPDELRSHVIRRNGDSLPTLLVDGRVAGVWRAVEGGIEATALRPLSAADWAGLAREATALRAFLADRDPEVYSRYGRWWEKLPDGEVRVLGA